MAGKSTSERTARLDHSLARAGQTVTLRRRVGTLNVFADVQIRARLSGYGAEELVGGVKQTNSKFIMSPNGLDGTTWPGKAGGSLYPVIGDFLVVDGRQRKIEAVQPVVIGGAVVRLEGRVLG